MRFPGVVLLPPCSSASGASARLANQWAFGHSPPVPTIEPLHSYYAAWACRAWGLRTGALDRRLLHGRRDGQGGEMRRDRQTDALAAPLIPRGNSAEPLPGGQLVCDAVDAPVLFGALGQWWQDRQRAASFLRRFARTAGLSSRWGRSPAYGSWASPPAVAGSSGAGTSTCGGSWRPLAAGPGSMRAGSRRGWQRCQLRGTPGVRQARCSLGSWIAWRCATGPRRTTGLRPSSRSTSWSLCVSRLGPANICVSTVLVLGLLEPGHLARREAPVLRTPSRQRLLAHAVLAHDLRHRDPRVDLLHCVRDLGLPEP